MTVHSRAPTKHIQYKQNAETYYAVLCYAKKQQKTKVGRLPPPGRQCRDSSLRLVIRSVSPKFFSLLRNGSKRHGEEVKIARRTPEHRSQWTISNRKRRRRHVVHPTRPCADGVPPPRSTGGRASPGQQASGLAPLSPLVTGRRG